MYVRQNVPQTRIDKAKKAACDWDYKKSWFPAVPKKGVMPLTKEELDSIRDASKYQFCFELIADDVVLCSNRHGSIALIQRGYLPLFFVQG